MSSIHGIQIRWSWGEASVTKRSFVRSWTTRRYAELLGARAGIHAVSETLRARPPTELIPSWLFRGFQEHRSKITSLDKATLVLENLVTHDTVT